MENVFDNFETLKKIANMRVTSGKLPWIDWSDFVNLDLLIRKSGGKAIRIPEKPINTESYYMSCKNMIARENYETMFRVFRRVYTEHFKKEFLQEQTELLLSDREKEWAHFFLDNMDDYVNYEIIGNECSIENICDEHNLPFEQINECFEGYKPFLHSGHMYKYLHDKLDTPHIQHFYILLYYFYGIDYRFDRKIVEDAKKKWEDKRTCSFPKSCKYNSQCSKLQICISSIVYSDSLSGYNFEIDAKQHKSEKEIKQAIKELYRIKQKEIIEHYINFAEPNIKDKVLTVLFRSFEQINKLFKDYQKFSLSYNYVLYNNKDYPDTGDFFLSWENVTFHDGYFELYHPYEYEGIMMVPYRIEDKKSRKVFNQLDRLFVKKVPPLYVRAKRGNIVEVYTDMANIMSHIELMEYHVFMPKNIKKKNEVANQKKVLTKDEAVNLCSKSKSVFLNYLCESHLEEYKVICSIEKKVHASGAISTENSLIFTIKKSSKRLYLAFENVEDSRCTYIFPIPLNMWQESVDKLYDFFASYENNKRQALSKRLIDLNLPGGEPYIRVMHKDFDKWVERIKNCK